MSTTRRPSRLVLFRHPISLLPSCACIGAGTGIALWLLERLGSPVGMLITACAALIWLLLRVLVWWSFRIIISSDRVQVRSWSRGILRRKIYPIPALSTLGSEQRFLEALLNSGSLVLDTARGQHRYPFLTPFSALKKLLG